MRHLLHHPSNTGEFHTWHDILALGRAALIATLCIVAWMMGSWLAKLHEHPRFASPTRLEYMLHKKAAASINHRFGG